MTAPADPAPQAAPAPGSTGRAWTSRLGKARHDLRNPLTEILGFSEVLQDEAAEHGWRELLPGFQGIHQAASRILADVNHSLNPDTLRAAPGSLSGLEQTIHRLSAEILAATERLSDQCDQLETCTLGDDLLRIAGATHTLRKIAPGLLGGLAVAEQTGESPADELRPFEPDAAGETSAVPPGTATAVGAGGALLVVDDSEANRALLARRLRRQGYTVLLAENGRQALEKVRTRKFDLLLLDILMPEMDGFEVLRRLKAEPATQNIPVIMLSALDDLDAVVRCIELGADDYLPKPFPAPLLQARVRACLANKRLSDQLRKYTAWLFGKSLFSQAVAAPDSLALHAQQRAVLFMDIRGFTGWSEPRSPEEVVEMLNRYLETAEGILVPSTVIKTEYTGDEIMAVFPETLDAARIALAFQDQLGALLAPLNLGVGIGIHTGPVIEGLMGSAEVKAYCFVGDTVNTANRVCEQAAGGQILISTAARALLGERVEVSEPFPLQAKGKTQPIEVFPLIRLQPEPEKGGEGG
jgi:DNA-binding response OmpR family regulator